MSTPALHPRPAARVRPWVPQRPPSPRPGRLGVRAARPDLAHSATELAAFALILRGAR